MATDRIAWELTADPVPIERAFERAGVAADRAYERANTAITKETGLINTLAIRLDRLKVARDKAHDPKQIERINRLINEQSNRLNHLTGNVTRLGNEMSKTTKKAEFLGGQIQNLAGMIASAFAINTLIQFGQEMTKVAAEVQSLTIRMEALTGSEASAVQKMNQLMVMSDQLGLSFVELSTNFVQFVSAAESAGIEVPKAESMFLSMSKAIAASGVSSEAANRAFVAMTQIMGKGQLTAEDWKGQFAEAIPQAMGWLQKATGKTTQELAKMMEQGQLSSDVLMDVARVAEQETAGSIEKMSDSISANLNRLENAWTKLYLSVADSGIAGTGVKTLTLFVEGLEKAWLGLSFAIAAVQTAMGNPEKMAQFMAEMQKNAVARYRSEKAIEASKYAQSILDANAKESAEEQVKILERRANTLESAQVKSKNLTEEEINGNVELQEKAKALRDLAVAINKEKGKGKGMTDAEIKAQQKANAEKLKAVEIERKRLEATIKFLVDLAAADAIEIGLSKKKWNDLIRINTDGLDEIKTPYESALYQLDRLRSRDEINEEQYLERKLELQRQFSENSVKTFDELFKFRKNKEEENTKLSIEQERQRNQLIAESALELTGLLSNAYESQTIDLQRQLDKGLITQESYEARLRQIKRKEFEVDRIAALAKIAINTAVQASAATPLLAPFVIAAGGAQALVVATRPNPYAKGTKRVEGGEKGKDSVLYDSPTGLSLLMPDEMIMPAKKTIAHAPYLDNVYDGNISPTQSRWAAGLFVNQTIEPGLLRYMASISGGGVSDNRQISQLVKAITKKKSPDFNKPADRIVKAIYQTSTSNSFSSWRKYRK